MSLLARFQTGLAKMRRAVQAPFPDSRPTVSEHELAALEESLLAADFGVETTEALMKMLKARLKQGGLEKAAVSEVLRRHMRALFHEAFQKAPSAGQNGTPLKVILVVGVNGTGKTTTIGKLARFLTQKGDSVVLAAADTFRAAAEEQLEIWGGRVHCPVVRHPEGASPAAVVYDALQEARRCGANCVIVDTAGRLHTRTPLMEELKKIARVAGKEIPGAPHEVLLVLDAGTGQNALPQARQFHQALGVTGLILTKMDGTARGGSVLRIVRELGLPVRYIGVGEGADDLLEFSPDVFLDALFGEGDAASG